MPSHRGTALALAILLALPISARARTPGKGKLAAYNLFGPMSLLGISGLLTRQAVERARGAGYRVTSADDAEGRVGFEALKKLAACELRPACLAELSRPLGGGLLLAGTLDRDDVHYVVRLVLVDLDDGRLVASAERQVLIAARHLDAEFDAMLPDLLAGKSTAPTRLALTSGLQHVRVQVDDRPLGEAPLTLELPPGRHEVRAEKTNFLPSDRFVEVAPGTTTTVELALTQIPNRPDLDAPASAPQAVPMAEAVHTERSRGGVPVATWVSFGVAVAAAGAGTYFAIAEKGISKRAVDADGDGVLDLTRADALAGHRDAAAANICFAAAGVAALTGAVIWLATDLPAASPSDTRAQLGVTPLRGGAAASVTWGF